MTCLITTNILQSEYATRTVLLISPETERGDATPKFYFITTGTEGRNSDISLNDPWDGGRNSVENGMLVLNSKMPI